MAKKYSIPEIITVLTSTIFVLGESLIFDKANFALCIRINNVYF